MAKKPDRWSDPKKARSPSESPPDLFLDPAPLPAFQDRETIVFCEMIRINRDAAAFYRVARGKMEDPDVILLFAALETTHDTVADNMSLRLRTALHEAPEIMREAECDARAYFGPLARDLPYGLSRQLVSHLEEAEEHSLYAMEETLDDKISAETRAFLVEQLDILVKTQEYIQLLRAEVIKNQPPLH